MNIKKIAQVAGLVSRRDSRMKVVQKGRKTLQIDFLGNELEKQQLLATFSYSSNLLTIQTDSANEQLSIISSSESGNDTITTSSGSWTGTETDITALGSELYVNQPSGLASILINDNVGGITGSTFSFGSSSANFVDDLTVNHAGTSGALTVANPVRFAGGSNLSLMGRNISVTANLITATGDITLYGNGGAVIGRVHLMVSASVVEMSI